MRAESPQLRAHCTANGRISSCNKRDKWLIWRFIMVLSDNSMTMLSGDYNFISNIRSNFQPVCWMQVMGEYGAALPHERA